MTDNELNLWLLEGSEDRQAHNFIIIFFSFVLIIPPYGQREHQKKMGTILCYTSDRVCRLLPVRGEKLFLIKFLPFKHAYILTIMPTDKKK